MTSRLLLFDMWPRLAPRDCAGNRDVELTWVDRDRHRMVLERSRLYSSDVSAPVHSASAWRRPIPDPKRSMKITYVNQRGNIATFGQCRDKRLLFSLASPLDSVCDQIDQ